jgi:hypothetical protein
MLFPMSTDFFFTTHCSTFLENVIFSNNYDTDSNLDFFVNLLNVPV